MTENEEITIQKVYNGYIVFVKKGPNTMLSNDEIIVFQSFRELNSFLKTHFTFRSDYLVSDE